MGRGPALRRGRTNVQHTGNSATDVRLQVTLLGDAKRGLTRMKMWSVRTMITMVKQIWSLRSSVSMQCLVRDVDRGDTTRGKVRPRRLESGILPLPVKVRN